jgi:hypothetical protein
LASSFNQVARRCVARWGLIEPSCTTADITAGAVVYLSGDALRGAFLNPDEQDGLDAPFDVNAWFVGQIEESLSDWFAKPRLTFRPQLSAWALDAPPADRAD